MPRVTCGRVAFALLVAGTIACFVVVGTLKPPYYDDSPPAFDVAKCAACTTQPSNGSSACRNIFSLPDQISSPSDDVTSGLVCPAGTNTCCCPHRDTRFYNVRCAASPSPTECLCRFERLCYENCSLEGLVPFLVGLVGAAIVGFTTLGWCCSCYCCKSSKPTTAEMANV
ncbi:Aste57867_12017 [Aphanomyces stellatus]|uniref:Aste57867_12017 protein n=1 Tax=Aphanomyces stellatus TaxID=120398 RepID=A0A485KUG4_9STRA|nr:hypothetical protein As57867_011972 [Aphanomyces stellatus]VFT88872.1 Aste57867_12017 [Aphanomyces stellatus]